ncbi:fimbrial protein [Cronobacter dublinensis]|uniref:fimbrial protein n=1 Tax=Cronobacter dublinensis TaxID=413497 RepID=UPI001376377F|nr:fimbrial protein [Cronobacter dublinensis]EKY3087310.1 fimbrial protein [Cronobacter dublinensis]ELQ6228099.1 fimbrial protein [Cronobacter dublinensis]ELY4005754.1 fimbrial protein [Cronobacter dublinensis]ELY4407098.1 fimbrial protein [Cronobacter dublinensis]ELY5817734.1 fimbrial protein [Cronobacter dublinensis]
MKLFRLAAAALLSAMIIGTVYAKENTAIITVKVTVNAAPCEINNNQLIDVDFGDSVITTDVAKGTVEKTVNYTLNCTNADQSKTLVMRISGVGADFDNNVLKTSIAELGVKMKADGADYPLNSDLVLASPTDKPALTALLVQQPGARLPTGGFTAGATLTVDYQ